MNHLFIVDDLKSLNPVLDSSLRMAFHLAARGDRIFLGYIEDLYWILGEPCARIQAFAISFREKPGQPLTDSDPTSMQLAAFHCIHMRKDPPFDQRYLEATWLLSSVEGRVPILNPPEKLRSWNEKMLIFRFAEFAAPGVVAAKAEHLASFASDQARDLIMKPLELFGGRGVTRIQAANQDDAELTTTLRSYLPGDQHQRIIQPFDSRVFEGEVRAFCAGGKPLAWCQKTPQRPSFLANTAAGAKLSSYNPTVRDLEVAQAIAKELWQEGVAFCGLDLIGGNISEINITSPRLLCADPDQENSYYSEIASFISDYCKNFWAKHPAKG